MSTIVCYCNHEESDHGGHHGDFCNQPGCECLEFDKRGRHRLEGNEWRDGAGDVWTEKWVMLVLDRDTHDRGPEIRAHGPVVGTEERAKEMLQQAAASWGQGRRLGVARIIEPEIVQHDATITW